MSAGTTFDPITLEVYWNRLISLMDEVDTTLVRTSFSSIVGDSRDFAVIMLDGTGRSVAQSVFSSPSFTGTLPFTVKAFLEKFPLETLRPGDVLLTNDPWLGAGHLPDFCIAMPVFYRGKVVSFMATAAHIADIGGTLGWFDARDLFEEGLRIPPLKLYDAGEPNTVLLEMIAANVRVPDQVLGDVGAIRAAEIVGGRRLVEFLDDTGLPDLQDLADAILGGTERAMRAAIADLPDGVCYGEAWADGVNTPLHIKVKVEVRGDEIHLDFAGSSAQYAQGSINICSNLTFADNANSLKCALLPSIPNNEGLFRPIHISAPEGSVLNATFPVSVKSRSKASFHIHNAVYAALAQLAPEKVQAGSGSFWAFTANGAWPDGSRYNVHFIPNGGKGAVYDEDGLPTIAFPYNGTITPAEIIESQSPLLMTERRLLPDSGGPGRRRGGLGERITIRAREGTDVTASLRPDKVRIPVPGLLGGKPAPLGVCLVRGETLAGDASVVNLKEGDEVTFCIPGGGGYGPPEDREPELVARDVALGYVSPEAARTEYLVAFKPATHAVDWEETRRLRGAVNSESA